MVVTPEEIKAVTPPTSKVMEILQFVKGDEIDPIFFESSYYVAPEIPPARNRTPCYSRLSGRASSMAWRR